MGENRRPKDRSIGMRKSKLLVQKKSSQKMRYANLRF